MANYTPKIDWQGKNNLSDSSAEKVISGTDFQTEFDEIQTIFSETANVDGSTTQAFATSTAAEASNTELTASTRYVTTAISNAVTTINGTYEEQANTLLTVYPVGCVYTSIVSTNPSSLFGGTWVAFGAGRVLVGLDSSDSDFNSTEETGGAKTHELTEAQMPEHTHGVTHTTVTEKVTGSYDGNRTHSNLNANASTETTTTTGSGNEHNNLQPYIVVYFFKRTL